jgi:AcrR family transcriptional regulator
LVTDVETPVPGRRDRKKLQTRAALMAAALRLVDERGLSAVTVEEISAAADVSTRTFFNYFATKDDAIIGDPLVEPRAMGERLRTVAAEIPMTGALLLALGPAVARIETDRELWTVRLRVIKNNPSMLPALLARATTAEQEFAEVIAERSGTHPDDAYPQVVAGVVGAAFRSAMLRWSAGSAAQPLADLVNEAFGIVATGLMEPPGANGRLQQPSRPPKQRRTPQTNKTTLRARESDDVSHHTSGQTRTR